MSKKSPKDDEFIFEGFEQSNTTPVPDILFDKLLLILSGTELKVLLYIIRRTAGFKKTTDSISLSQFMNGIVTRDGKRLDDGCGVKRRQSIIDALIRLEELGLIISRKTKTSDNDNATTVYQVRFKGVVSKTDHLVSKTDHGSTELKPPVVSKTDPQETVIQETVIQERKNEGTPNPGYQKLAPSPPSTPSASPIATTPIESEATGNASTQRNTEPLMSESRRVFALLCERFFAIPPKFTAKVEEQCNLLAPHVKTSEDMNSLWDYSRAKNEADSRIIDKQVYLGNLLKYLNGWKQEQARKEQPKQPKQPKQPESRPYQMRDLAAEHKKMIAEFQAKARAAN